MPPDARGGRDATQTIGFHELRQACEISALRQDLERLIDETSALRTFVDEQVERVSSRFAALTPGDLADAARMLPLLEYAVATLAGIRDAARRASLATGAIPDDQRPAPPRLRGMDVPTAAMVPAPAPPPPPAAAQPPAAAPAVTAPAPVPSPIQATPVDSLLMSATSAAPPPARPGGTATPGGGSVAAPVWVLPAATPATPRGGRRTDPPKDVDWLGRGKSF